MTGGSRGIGAATARALAARGYDVAITYRNKGARAEAVATELQGQGGRARAMSCDMTRPDDVERLVAEMREWSGRLDALVLNASGGLERDLVAADPTYPMRLNRDAQVALVEALLPLMGDGSSVVFVTSHWAHWHGRVLVPAIYEPVAATKHAGEEALRARQDALAAQGARLLVVTGDLIEGTITPKLLERVQPGIFEQRREAVGHLPTVDQMGDAIAAAAADPTLASGHTVVVGGGLESLP